ncbi:DUF917 domain-containing protein [Elongatibacter sediminis]|uniref:DUF917 domain-containing protein n=1 Tax=Elongatibacter sediminis TaxID=3119006 RepID=A0AAW9RJI0_9GAMM
MEIRNKQDVRDMARGAAFLGVGGGGDPYVGQLMLQQEVLKGRYPRVIKADELDDDARVLSVCGIGSPPVLVEHLLSSRLLSELMDRMEEHLGYSIDALISAEIGGLNSVMTLGVAAQRDLPLIDADGMGRAFPKLELVTFSVYGCPASPVMIMDELGNMAIVQSRDDATAEMMSRAISSSLGAMVYSALYPMTGRQVKDFAVHDTISLCYSIGKCIRESREELDNPFDGLLALLNRPEEGRHCRLLFDGKIVDLVHEIRDAWHFGTITMEANGNPDDVMVVEMQNEYLAARHNGKTVTMVPDLLCILDAETAEPITGERLKYGQRIKVVGLSAAPIMRRPECLAVFGPGGFGYKEEFKPIEELNP